MLIPFIRYLVIFTSCIFATPGWSSSPTFSDVFVFGDSLSDTGNFASVNGPFPTPPFFNNRVSNGLTSVDLLAQSLRLRVNPSLHLVGPAIGTNYAVTGARTAGVSPFDLPTQVAAFSANHGGVAPTDALYVINIGGNDVRDARDTQDNLAAKQLVGAAVHGEIIQIQNLINMGAQYILVVNVTNIGNIPETNLIAAQLQDSQFVQRAAKLSQLFNYQLKKRLKLLSHKNDITLVRFNQFEAFEELLADSSELDFTNTTDACFSTVSLSFNLGCNFGAAFDQYVFFDEIHPTARTNKIIAKELIKELTEFEDDDEDEDENEQEEHEYEKESNEYTSTDDN